MKKKNKFKKIYNENIINIKNTKNVKSIIN